MKTFAKLLLSLAIMLSGCAARLPDNLKGDLRVHYIDVGQGNAVFVELPKGKTMLIDAGENDCGDDVVDYVESFGYRTIDYLIGTHPHSDHIGGIDTVIDELKVKKFYMTKAQNNTKTFEDILDACEENGLQINTAKAGVRLFEGDELTADFVAPVKSSYNDLNEYSAVIKLTYGEVSFLFTGDMQQVNEEEVTADVSADVLLVAHHGSKTSTNKEFLNKVNPQYAVISVGEDNPYGHPHKPVLKTLFEAGVTIFRTDIDGTVIFACDKKNLTLATEKTGVRK